jgi:hypothetical protein
MEHPKSNDPNRSTAEDSMRRQERVLTRPASTSARWLEQHAGFVLIATGAGLIALAAIFRGTPAVAPMFGLFGSVMVILGCFASRIEGDIEVSKDGLRTVVREIERLRSEEGLPAESVPALLEDAIDRYEPRSRRPTDVQHAARDAARDAIREGDVIASPVIREFHLLDAFGGWLDDRGWDVVRGARVGTRQIDLIGSKDGETLLVEAKGYTRPAGLPAIRQAMTLRSVFPDRRPRVALLLSEEAGITADVLEVARRELVEIYVVDPGGGVRRVDRSE